MQHCSFRLITFLFVLTTDLTSSWRNTSSRYLISKGIVHHVHLEPLIEIVELHQEGGVLEGNSRLTSTREPPEHVDASRESQGHTHHSHNLYFPV